MAFQELDLASKTKSKNILLSYMLLVSNKQSRLNENICKVGLWYNNWIQTKNRSERICDQGKPRQWRAKIVTSLNKTGEGSHLDKKEEGCKNRDDDDDDDDDDNELTWRGIKS